MKILGIDPGLQRTGWGLIHQQGNRLSYIASGTVTSAPKQHLDVRLKSLHDGIARIIDLHRPNTAAIEETFVNVNAASTLKLGQARGALLLTLSLAELPVAMYSATQVKKSIVGAGRADKTQIIAMVNQLLPTANVTQPDEADALAIALTHANHAHLANAIASTCHTPA